MENKYPSGKYWFWCFVWTAIMAFMLIYSPLRQFFWLALPGYCTYFAKGMNIMDANVKG